MWSRCAGVGMALSAAACVPNEDLSSYASAASEAASPSASPIAPGTIIAPWPPLAPDTASDAAEAIAGGASPGFVGEAALHGDGGAATPAPTGVASSDASPPAAPSRPGALVGESRHTLDVAGVERSFLYYAPAKLDPDVAAPVLIVAHGFEETAAQMVTITGYDTIADREGFVVLYPEGQRTVPWNIGSGVCQGGARPVASASGDDSALVDAMLEFVAIDRAVDGAHVFMAGLASGGYLASDLACRRSDIRAIAMHSAGSHALDACVAAQKPVLLLHGSEDAAVPLACSLEARDRWAAHNGCDTSAEALAVLGGVCEASLGCPAGGQVTACTFEGMGRGWAGGSAQAASFLEFESASELSWRFFTTFAW